jgi:ribosomal protein L11
MAAGFEKIALIASWGAATPTPPMALDMGPIPIRLSPFVAKAAGETIPSNPSTKNTKNTPYNSLLLLLLFSDTFI